MMEAFVAKCGLASCRRLKLPTVFTARSRWKDSTGNAERRVMSLPTPALARRMSILWEGNASANDAIVFSRLA